MTKKTWCESKREKVSKNRNGLQESVRVLRTKLRFICLLYRSFYSNAYSISFRQYCPLLSK